MERRKTRAERKAEELVSETRKMSSLFATLSRPFTYIMTILTDTLDRRRAEKEVNQMCDRMKAGDPVKVEEVRKEAMRMINLIYSEDLPREIKKQMYADIVKTTSNRLKILRFL